MTQSQRSWCCRRSTPRYLAPRCIPLLFCWHSCCKWLALLRRRVGRWSSTGRCTSSRRARQPRLCSRRRWGGSGWGSRSRGFWGLLWCLRLLRVARCKKIGGDFLVASGRLGTWGCLESRGIVGCRLFGSDRCWSLCRQTFARTTSLRKGRLRCCRPEERLVLEVSESQKRRGLTLSFGSQPVRWLPKM